MMRRTLPVIVLALVLGPSLFATNLTAQNAAQETPRAIRRDIPITTAFRRALTAGDRKSVV